jgi:hypothetical protein
MKHFFFILIALLIFSTANSYSEVLHVYLENMNGGVACVRDTISADVDTIQVIPYSENIEMFSPYVMLYSLEGEADSFFCEGDPSPGEIVQISVWDSNATHIVGTDTIQGAFSATKIAVDFDTVGAGSLPIPISFRDSVGVSEYPLDWVDGMRHYPYMLFSEQDGDSIMSEWHPPFSRVWNFYIHVGTGTHRAICDFCVCYNRKR